MAELNLTELRKVAEAATPGPWLRNPNDRCEVLAENDDPMFPEFPFEFVITDCNGQASISEQDFAHIIAFHPPTVLALLDRVAELEAAVGRVQELMDDAEQRPTDWNGLLSTRKVRQAIDGRDPIEILREKLTGGESDE